MIILKKLLIEQLIIPFCFIEGVIVMSVIKTNAMNNFANADITDDIFFCRIMSEKQYALPLLQRIFPQLNIRSIEQPISQFTIKNNRKEHGVRFDVFSEAEQKYFDIEMQTTHDPTLGKRIRYYQGKMDSTFLKAGESYDLLPPTYIVFICTFDPFAEGSYKYEFSHIYDQTNHVTLKTGTHVILLNAYGTNPESINGGLLNFLKLVAGEKDMRYDPYLKQIQDKIAQLKDNMQWRMMYMQQYNAIAVKERAEGLEQGIAQGRAEGLKQGREKSIVLFIKNMLAQGSNEKDILNTLMIGFQLSEEEANNYLRNDQAKNK